MATPSKKLNVERIPLDTLSEALFVERYMRPEMPVIVSGVTAGNHDELTPEYFKKAFEHKERRRMGWFDAALTDDSGPIRIPALVAQLLDRTDVVLRPFPMRAWLQPKGHRTLPHYDGNSVHGLNLQVHGRKRWLVIPPTDPLPSVAFGFASAVAHDFDVRRTTHPYAEFTTEPGDMVFLPRYWIHEVESLESINMNINWVFTPTMPNRASPLGVRECELLKAQRSIPWVAKLLPITEDNYGGGGHALVDRYIDGVSTAAAVKRLLAEVVKIPRTLFLKNTIVERTRQLSRSNFNVN